MTTAVHKSFVCNDDFLPKGAFICLLLPHDNGLSRRHFTRSARAEQCSVWSIASA
jgi:hypothetical protein